MRTKNIISKSLVLLLVFCFCLSAISYGNPVTYQITETELTELDQSYQEQEQLLIEALKLQEMQKEELKGLKLQLESALKELRESREALQRLKEDLKKASNSIEEVNQLFNKYEAEARATQSRLKRQRNLYLLLLIGVGVFKASENK